MEEQEFIIFDNNIRRTGVINKSGQYGATENSQSQDRRSYSVQDKHNDRLSIREAPLQSEESFSQKRGKSLAERSFAEEVQKTGINTLNQNLVFDHKLKEKINVQKG